MAVAILRPNADVSNAWTIIGGAPDATMSLDDEIEQPTAGDGFYLRTDSSGAVVEVHLGTIVVGTVSQAKVWAYIASDASAGSSVVRLLTGSTELASVSVPGNTAASWVSATYTGSLTQAEVDDLRVRDTYSSGTAGNYAYLDTAYVELTFTVAGYLQRALLGVG